MKLVIVFQFIINYVLSVAKKNGDKSLNYLPFFIPDINIFSNEKNFEYLMEISNSIMNYSNDYLAKFYILDFLINFDDDTGKNCTNFKKKLPGHLKFIELTN